MVTKRQKLLFKLVPIDEWGDEGKWTTLVDFTEMTKDGRGVPIEYPIWRMEEFRKNRKAEIKY